MSKKNCIFASQTQKERIMEISNTKQIFTDSEIVTAIKGMMNAKNEWLQYVQRREAELGI